MPPQSIFAVSTLKLNLPDAEFLPQFVGISLALAHPNHEFHSTILRFLLLHICRVTGMETDMRLKFIGLHRIPSLAHISAIG